MRHDLERMKDDADNAIDGPVGYPVRPMDLRDRLQSLAAPATRNTGFSFRYACTEISSYGGKTHVKSRETRFENGKLVSEQCEASLDHDAAQRMLTQAQHQVIGQVASLMKLCLAFWPGRPFDR
jgi:hypothetical protein